MLVRLGILWFFAVVSINISDKSLSRIFAGCACRPSTPLWGFLFVYCGSCPYLIHTCLCQISRFQKGLSPSVLLSPSLPGFTLEKMIHVVFRPELCFQSGVTCCLLCIWFYLVWVRCLKAQWLKFWPEAAMMSSTQGNRFDRQATCTVLPTQCKTVFGAVCFFV